MTFGANALRAIDAYGASLHRRQVDAPGADAAFNPVRHARALAHRAYPLTPAAVAADVGHLTERRRHLPIRAPSDKPKPARLHLLLAVAHAAAAKYAI